MSRVLRLTVQNLRAGVLRAVLIVVSLVLGVVIVTTTDSAGQVLKSTVEQRAILQNGVPDTYRVSGGQGISALLQQRTLDGALRRHAAVATSLDIQLRKYLVRDVRGHSVAADVNFVSVSYRTMRPFPIVSGAWLSQETAPLQPFACANRAANAAGTQLGDTLIVTAYPSHDRLPISIVCVLDDATPSPNVYVDASASGGFLQLNCSDCAIATTALVHDTDAATLSAALNGDVASDSGVAWEVRRSDTVGELSAEVSAVRTTFAFLTGLTLAAVLIAVASIALGGVRERFLELALRRALGTKRGTIVLAVLVESQLVALSAAVLSAPLALLLFPALIGALGSPFGVDAPAFPVDRLAFGAGVGCLAAACGYLPAAVIAFRAPMRAVMRE